MEFKSEYLKSGEAVTSESSPVLWFTNSFVETRLIKARIDCVLTLLPVEAGGTAALIFAHRQRRTRGAVLARESEARIAFRADVGWSSFCDNDEHIR